MEIVHRSHEDQAFFTKVYLSSGSWCRSRLWIDIGSILVSCCAKVKDSGEYDVHRQRFLNWLKTYLQSQAVTDPSGVADHGRSIKPSTRVPTPAMPGATTGFVSCGWPRVAPLAWRSPPTIPTW